MGVGLSNYCRAVFKYVPGVSTVPATGMAVRAPGWKRTLTAIWGPEWREAHGRTRRDRAHRREDGQRGTSREFCGKRCDGVSLGAFRHTDSGLLAVVSASRL